MSTIPRQESLTCEFKSDRQCLPDRELIETVVCTANGDSGDIYLGVEDTRQEVMDLCQLSKDQAYKLLKRLAENKLLEKQGD